MFAKRVRVLGSALVLVAGIALFLKDTMAAGITERSVRRTPLPGGVLLGYEWTDARGARRVIDLPVSYSALEASELALGFSIEELQSFLVAAEAGIREEMGISALDIAREVVSRISDPARCRVDKDPESAFQIVLRTGAAGQPVEQAEIDRVLAAFRRRWEAGRKEVCARLQARLKDYAGDHGMEVTPTGITVDYKKLVRDSAARLRPLAEEFRRRFGPSRRGLLEALYSFVLSVPYRPTPPVDGGRYTAGVSVPLRVLADDGADCDSKAVLFAALWVNLCGHRTVLIRIPEHMLVGVAGPFGDGAAVAIGSTRYLLLELSCPRQAAPGEVTLYSAEALSARNFKYRIVS